MPGYLASLELGSSERERERNGRGIMLLTLIAEAAPSSLLAFTRDGATLLRLLAGVGTWKP